MPNQAPQILQSGFLLHVQSDVISSFLSFKTYQVAVYDTVLFAYTSIDFSALKDLLSSLTGLRVLSYTDVPNF